MGLIREGELNQGRGWGSREREAVGKQSAGLGFRRPEFSPDANFTIL